MLQRRRPAILFLCALTPLMALASGGICTAVFSHTLSGNTAQTVQRYLRDTLKSFDLMRGESGLIKDTIEVDRSWRKALRILDLNASTSGTNIAIDLLIQAEIILQNQKNSTENMPDILAAKTRLQQVMSAVQSLPRHADTGLFYSWYSTDKPPRVKSYDLSSIDNLHLALALWTVAEAFPTTLPGQQAKTVFQSMDFSSYYDPTTGLLGGNFRYTQGRWVREAYNFSYFGSEARILYSVGHALGLFKSLQDQAGFAAKAFHAMQAEVMRSQQGPLLRLWDGAAFQLFFPKIFAGEEQISPTLKKMYAAAGEFMLSEGDRRGLGTPAAHTPGVSRIEQDEKGNRYSIYTDKAGNTPLVSTTNGDLADSHLLQGWEQVFNVSALMMAATANPERFLPILEKLESTRSKSHPLYEPGFGWMDGLHVTGEKTGQVVPAVLAVNSGMIALSLLQMQSPDGLSASARLLHSKPQVQNKMKQFYQPFEEKMAQGELK